MKKIILTAATILVIALSPSPLLALPSLALREAQEILPIIDGLRNFGDTDFSCLMLMISEDPQTGIERSLVRSFRRDREDKFLLLIQEPLVKRGQGYLMADDNLWFYDPESRKFSHTSLNEQFNDSEANNSDFGSSSLAEDYTVVRVEQARLGTYDVYVLELSARNDEVTYPTMRLWVTAEPYLVLKSEAYSAGGRRIRTSYYPSYTRIGGRYMATQVIFRDELVQGKQTRISMSEISTETLPDMIFTKSYVERVNK